MTPREHADAALAEWRRASGATLRLPTYVRAACEAAARDAVDAVREEQERQRERLATILYNAFGLEECLPTDALLTRLNELLLRQRDHVADLESQLEDADTVTHDAIGHVKAGEQGKVREALERWGEHDGSCPERPSRYGGVRSPGLGCECGFDRARAGR